MQRHRKLLHLNDDLNNVISGMCAQFECLVSIFQSELVSDQLAQINLALSDASSSIHEVLGAEAEGTNNRNLTVVDDVGVDGDGAAADQAAEDIDRAALVDQLHSIFNNSRNTNADKNLIQLLAAQQLLDLSLDIGSLAGVDNLSAHGLSDLAAGLIELGNQDVLVYGINLLFFALRKPKKSRFSVKKRGGNGEKSKWDCDIGTDYFDCSQHFGEHTCRVDLPLLRRGEANLSFGALTVDLTDCCAVSDNCHLDANCSFGELRLLVPQRFRVEPTSSAAFASVTVSGQPDTVPQGIIHLDANVSFGSITVEYV